MKKAIKIHISGYVFTIDEDAYEKILNWTEEISTQFEKEEGGNEIVEDIEARVAELFYEKIKDEDSVLTIKEINEVISIMGTPEDFSDESKEESTYKFGRIKLKKRLYRDEDNAFIGGVCGGLGNYFNIDPVYIRLAFVLAVFFGGFGTLIYLLIWIITPKAKTSAQKLEMKGEKVNVSNIQRTIKEEFESVRRNIVKQTNSENYKNISETIEHIIDALFKITKIIFKIAMYFIAGMFVFVGASVLISLIALIFFSIVPAFASSSGDFYNISSLIKVVPLSISGFWAQAGFILLIGVPLLTLVYAGFKIIFNFNANNKIIGLAGTSLWTIGLLISLSVGLNIANNFKVENQDIKTFILNKNTSDTLIIQSKIANSEDIENSEINFDNYEVSSEEGKFKIFGHPEFNIKKSIDNNITLKIKYKSNGKTRRQAFVNINNIKYYWQQKDSLLIFDDSFSLKGKQKLFAQEIKITLYIPEGKSVFLSQSMNDIIYDIDNVQHIWDGNMTDKVWTMTKDGLSINPN